MFNSTKEETNMFSGNDVSLADIAAVTNNNDGFGGNNGWWVLILLFAIFGGWGNGGWGANGSQGAANNYVLASDFATLQRQIDSTTADIKQGVVSIGNGLSSLGYDQLAQMNGINSNINNAQNVLMAQLNAMAAANAQCCCENKYLIAEQSCQTRQAVADAMANIINNDNSNYRALNDRFTAMEMAAKDDKIADLTARLNEADRRASLVDQSQYIINQVRPCPTPAFVVPNPYVNTSCGNSCCA